MSDDRFDELVGLALDAVPDGLARLMRNVAIFIEDEPPDGLGDLLGLYEGVPLTERDSWYAAGSMPDRITIFRRPTLAICDSELEVADEVRITVVHEIAHHFGIDDERLHELGYG